MSQLVKGIICEGHARVYLANTTSVVETAREKHDLWPTATAALGRTLSVTAVLGAMLKSEDEKLTVQINGGGEIGTIMCDAFPNGKVRGFVANPHVMMVNEQTGKLDVGRAVGNNGYLRVIRDISLKEDFTGTVQLISGEIGEDFAYYFTVSEQVPTAISVGVLVDENMKTKSAGVLVIQMLPNATDTDLTYCENIIQGLKPISQLIDEVEDPKVLLDEIFREDIEILESIDLSFECSCNRERMLGAIMTVSEEDLETMIKEDHGCEIVCQYCNKKYQITEEELTQILLDKRKKS